MVAKTDTVTYPWTMMIHFTYTSLTETTVMRSRWLYLLTLLTISELYKVTPHETGEEFGPNIG